MNEVLLDRQGTNSLSDGHFLVTTEVEFLKLATGNSPLQVRGAICDWAQTFCEARQIVCREMLSPIAELTGLCTELDETRSTKIIEGLGHKRFNAIERPLTVSKVLNAIYQGNIWGNEPSIRHASEWLLWLIEFNPPDHIQPLLKQISTFWMASYQEPEGKAYSVSDAESALALLKKWLGVDPDTKYVNWSAFPLGLPKEITATLRDFWSRKLVETQGAWLDSHESWPTYVALKKVMAEEAFKYFKNRRKGLTKERFDTLSTYLSWRDQKELQILLPPMLVSEMPSTPDAILSWFVKEYLPYRCWQFDMDDESAQKLINLRARSFEKWFLENYPKALSGSEMMQFIGFNKAGGVAKNSNQFVTLLIVMDGMHVADAHTLLLRIQELIPRLNLVVDDLAFTAIPTVTEFCKEALFRCVPPAQTDQAQPIGVIVPENELPISKLSKADLGDVFLWRVQEPDHTYHQRNKYDMLLRQVGAELESTAKNIQDIVERVPSEIPLQIMITTDHGRIIGTSLRKHSIPPAMECHGRAAWGHSGKVFGLEGYMIENDIAFLNGERYGMAYDVAIPLDSDTFLTSDGKVGREAFSHGGLYPEEVIIPWIGLVRDFVKPKVKIKLTGQASARKPGILKVMVTSQSEAQITIPIIELEFGNFVEKKTNLDFIIQPCAVEEFHIELEKWPTNAELKKSHCVCQIRQPNGIIFTVDGIIEIVSDELYRSDNILEDLI